MIVEEFLKLPPWFEFEGVHFTLRMINDGATEVRIYYAILNVDADSKHKAEYDKDGSWLNTIDNPTDPGYSTFCLMRENIETDADLIWAIRSLYHTLWDKGLFPNK